MKSSKTVLFGVLTALLVLALFQKSVIGRSAISRFDLLGKLDVLYDSSLDGSSITVPEDPSAALQAIPKEILIQESLRNGDSAIWNPLAGCGQSMVADPANTIWCPVDLLFSPQNQKLYNFGIVLKIAAGAIFSYLLFVRVGAAPWASSCAALGYALSAKSLNFVEMTTEAVPAVFLIFQFMNSERSCSRTFALASGLALCYLSIHPEIFFVAVISASFLWLFKTNEISDTKESLSTSFLNRFRELTKLGIMTIFLVAPLLFPFLEYLKNAQSYKYLDSSSQHLSLLELPFSFFLAKFPEALFPGIITILGLASGILLSFKKQKELLFLSIFWLLFACRPAGLNEILGKVPFSFLLPEYTFLTSLLMLCWLSALGLSYLNEANSSKPARKLFFLIASGLLAAAPYLLLCAKFKIPGLEINTGSKGLWINVLILFVTCLLLFRFKFSNEQAASGKFKLLFSFICCLLLPLTNFASMLTSAREELPERSFLKIPAPGREKLLSAMQTEAQYRSTACGLGLMPPNTGILYGLRDLRTSSPLNDRRYIKFMEALGAKLGYCNMIELPYSFNSLINLASVKYILSDSAIASKSTERQLSDISEAEKSQESYGRIMPGLRLMQANFQYNPDSAQIEAKLLFRVHEHLNNRYQLKLAVADLDTKALWQSNPQTISANLSERHLFQLHSLLPIANQDKRKMLVLLQIRDSWTGELVQADGSNFINKEAGIKLFEFETEKRQKISSPDKRFTLVEESPDLLRVYKNEEARPRCFLVHSLIQANSEQESLARISDKNFDSKRSCVIEGWQRESLAPGKAANQNNDRVGFLKDRNTEIEIESQSDSDAILVLNDLFYPGWQAEVDGQSQDIYRCNYLFRGVFLKAGKHLIQFKYAPLSFLSGLFLQFIAVAFALICLFKEKRKAVTGAGTSS
ncbi:MAG: YfhO family protein [Candidatus Obscuribacterales bacterium]|nr:YfhO family protein [Candidatus Obscuribacterales bacterium]